jgi:hypothetical protein
MFSFTKMASRALSALESSTSLGKLRRAAGFERDPPPGRGDHHIGLGIVVPPLVPIQLGRDCGRVTADHTNGGGLGVLMLHHDS